MGAGAVAPAVASDVAVPVSRYRGLLCIDATLIFPKRAQSGVRRRSRRPSRQSTRFRRIDEHVPFAFVLRSHCSGGSVFSQVRH